MATVTRRWSMVILLAAALPLGAAVFTEEFSSNPLANGWRTFGDSSLFQWNSAGQHLAVTWDSSRVNSYFYVPLGTIVSKADNFRFSFDLRLDDIRVGNTPGKSNEFQIAIGLMDIASAKRTNHFVGAGLSAAYGIRNVVEFDYFPDAGLGETLASVVASTNNHIYPAHNFPLPLTTGDTFRITFSYTAGDQVLRTSATKNGTPFGLPPGNSLAALSLAGTSDFRVDAFAVMSYSDAIQTSQPQFHGSILAQGTVDNVRIEAPPPAVSNLELRCEAVTCRAQFSSRTNWTYTLERSVDLRAWEPVAPAAAGTGSAMALEDLDPRSEVRFYRVRAERP